MHAHSRITTQPRGRKPTPTRKPDNTPATISQYADRILMALLAARCLPPPAHNRAANSGSQQQPQASCSYAPPAATGQGRPHLPLPAATSCRAHGWRQHGRRGVLLVVRSSIDDAYDSLFQSKVFRSELVVQEFNRQGPGGGAPRGSSVHALVAVQGRDVPRQRPCLHHGTATVQVFLPFVSSCRAASCAR